MSLHRSTIEILAAVVAALIVGAFAAVLLAPPAHAEAPGDAAAMACGDRGRLAATLAERYGERPVARGVTATGAVFEIFAAPGGGSWTAVVTLPGGLSCMMSAGARWQRLPRPAPKRDTSGGAAAGRGWWI